MTICSIIDKDDKEEDNNKQPRLARKKRQISVFFCICFLWKFEAKTLFKDLVMLPSDWAQKRVR